MKPMDRLLRLLIVSCAFLAVAFAQDLESLKQSIRARKAKVEALATAGVAMENKDTGLLQPAGSPDASQSQTIADENKDRLAVFKLISRETAVDANEVASMYGKRKALTPPSKPVIPGVGQCHLVPAKTPDALRLVVFLEQGMNYAMNKKYDLALKEFQPALAIDSNFLTLHMNISSVQTALGQFDDAVASANEELKLVACLEPLTDGQIAQFAYFMEVKNKSGPARGKGQAEALRDRLPKVKADRVRPGLRVCRAEEQRRRARCDSQSHRCRV